MDRTWRNRGKRIVVNLQTSTKILLLQCTNKIIKLIYLDKDGVNRCLGQASYPIVTISGADQNAHNCIGALFSFTRNEAGYRTFIHNIHCLVRDMGSTSHWWWIPKFPRYPASLHTPGPVQLGLCEWDQQGQGPRLQQYARNVRPMPKARYNITHHGNYESGII